MKIKEFGVERWMDLYEHHCAYNLAETCVESLTVDQLLTLTGRQESVLDDLRPMKLTYGAIEGTSRLREAIARTYSKQSAANVIVTHGAIGGNALIYETLVEPGDTVVSVMPTYQQHYSIPESYGANVKVLKLREENGFLPDLSELESLVDGKTRLIAINNPNNPTGSLMDEAFLSKVAEIARRCDAHVLCDEVYRGTDQQGSGYSASIADLYEKGISTASMSKTYSLAGLRLGWIAGPTDLIRAVAVHRDYNTISVGMIDDYFATLALEHRDAIMQRNLDIVRTNLAILEAWVDREPAISWIKPKSGTTALLKYAFDMPSREFCVELLEATGVMFTPGSALEMEGYVRIGYANHRDVLEKGLARVSDYLRTKAS
ncbi:MULTISPECIES: aminotransferase [Burkholderia]|uniref:Aminotransferase n=1 Tax=Burkholderia contaminans TaxID=488447 RepID=A0A2S5DPF4_9BURK|nr:MULTISPECIES: aminotransferase [Burkholderia]EKS9793913.1 aminotransferase [Burkholderia cepacia]EKS9803444.1 aminotransferase [Burkholderia cepacia]EKS9811576.1 aminotransferase [Burkholderia cepacia]EKS9819395.1 aminotransferase [Burkholderia cepacia]EKS9826008.1 aminotransferase [Burkholderia cepacia]